MIQHYTFTIHGNQEKKEGNPIPCIRTNKKSQWTEKAQRYNAWKDYVRKAFFEMAKNVKPSREYNLLEMRAYKNKGRPLIIEKGENCEVVTMIYFANDRGGDGDNIFKGIADALFVNDKRVNDGHFKWKLSGDKKGRVDVTIIIFK